jgi:hypothetical protein
MEENKVLELRMYFFVPYNISEIAKGIQAGHASLEYARHFGDTATFKDFVDNWKTWVILNGGTTNNGFDFEGKPLGSLNEIINTLQDNDIDIAYFQEPDLNDALTAICFICDERVFNRKDYPDFIDYLNDVKLMTDALMSFNFMPKKTVTFEEHFSEEYKEWVRFVGGMKNVVLRDIIKDKRLA